MKPLLTRENRPLLDQLAWSNVLLAFDFDGTLAPIVANRHRAAMRARTARLFAAVCARYPSAVISGRGTADVGIGVRAPPVAVVVDEKFATNRGQVAEEIDQRLAPHG